MKTRNLLLISMTLALLVGLFIAISSVMAAEVLCGNTPGAIPDGVVGVKKTVKCSLVRDWTWSILKEASETNLTLSEGQSYLVNYLVTASAVAQSNYSVEGTIDIINKTGNEVVITSVSDSLGAVSSCSRSLPATLQPGWAMSCLYSGSQSSQPSVNVATVAYTGSAGSPVSATATIDWDLATVTETDECADISDTFAGATGLPATVCADGQTTFTFPYSRTIGPYAVCGDYTVDNTARFITNDNGETDSSSETVNVHVPCAGGCSLTPGYWKTHSINGPAPYDNTWALLPHEEDTPFFSSGKSYYLALWTSPQGNAYWILAHAYIAAQLNFLNGADPSSAQSAFNQATALLAVYTPAQVGAMRGSNPVRQEFIRLAGILDDYNNGLIGPGHCSE